LYENKCHDQYLEVTMEEGRPFWVCGDVLIVRTTYTGTELFKLTPECTMLQVPSLTRA